MKRNKERFVIDERGNRVAVLLDIAGYQRLLTRLGGASVTSDAATHGSPAPNDVLASAGPPFGSTTDLDTLAARQGVQAVPNISALAAGVWPDDEPLDDFIAAVRQWRREG